MQHAAGRAWNISRSSRMTGASLAVSNYISSNAIDNTVHIDNVRNGPNWWRSERGRWAMGRSSNQILLHSFPNHYVNWAHTVKSRRQHQAFFHAIVALLFDTTAWKHAALCG